MPKNPKKLPNLGFLDPQIVRYTKQYINSMTVKFLEKSVRKHPYLSLKRGVNADFLTTVTGQTPLLWFFSLYGSMQNLTYF
jgi:hypothetical protein